MISISIRLPEAARKVLGNAPKAFVVVGPIDDKGTPGLLDCGLLSGDVAVRKAERSYNRSKKYFGRWSLLAFCQLRYGDAAACVVAPDDFFLNQSLTKVTPAAIVATLTTTRWLDVRKPMHFEEGLPRADAESWAASFIDSWTAVDGFRKSLSLWHAGMPEGAEDAEPKAKNKRRAA